MTPAEAESLKGQMFLDHLEKMSAIGDAQQANVNLWVGVTGKMNEQFASAGTRADKIIQKFVEAKDAHEKTA
jgi:hypothetical protein